MLTEDDLELMWSDIKAKMVQMEHNRNNDERVDEEGSEGGRLHNGTAMHNFGYSEIRKAYVTHTA
jgi:hypothetical protein